MPNWTKDQSLAIEQRGGKVIVSAAAGSGKTAVLSQRVIKYVLDGGNISDLLIVTFTKAAAKEMKDRIKNKIKQACLEDPLNKHLNNQLLLVDIAKITTMDSFYSEIVKDNFEKLGIDRNFNILSNEEENILKQKVLNKVIEDGFDLIPGYNDMLSFLGTYNIDVIKSDIVKISDFLNTIPFKEKFIEKAIYNYKSNFYEKRIISQIKEKMSLYKKLYEDVIDELYNCSDVFDGLIVSVNKEKKFISDFLNIDNFDDLSSRLRTISFDTLKTPKGHKDDPEIIKYKFIRDDLKKEIKKNMQELSFIDENTYKKENDISENILKTIFKVVKIYMEELFLEKKRINSYSFSDIAFFVIDLLIKDNKKTELAIELSKSFKEILIDEYQDTNNLQNVIFNAISDNGNNLFIVGDVKQSIYRFRSACPEIFNNDKKLSYKDRFPKLITLSKNFRSRREVLDFCNFIFENTMSNLFGEVEYNENEKLYLGANFKEKDDVVTEVHIIDGKEKSEDELDELTNVQKEAIYVSSKIKELLDNNYQVFDNKLNCFRNIKESDIVILLRSLKNSEFFVKALNKRNISVYSQSSSTYFDNYEIKLVINILKVIDNPTDDIALMSLLNSSLFNVSLDEIANIRSKTKESIYEDILNGNNENLKSILNLLDGFRNLSHNESIYKLLVEIYNTLNIEPIIKAMKGGIQRQKNLIQMLNHAVNFEKNESKSLYEFISYIESVTLNKDSLEGINPLSEGDNVLITTIHKSKGLEYPVVFLCETGKNFNFSDIRSDLMINEELGVCFPIKNTNYMVSYESVAMMVFKEYEKSKLLSEELRVLYVALTRAKEKIIITGFSSNLSNAVTKAAAKIGSDNIISNLYLKGTKNYLDIILPCLLRHPALEELRNLSSIPVKTFATDSKVKLLIENKVNINESEFNLENKVEKENFDMSNFKKVCDFEYNHSLCNVPKTLSVSNIKNKIPFFKRPNFMTDGINHTKKGTLYHLVLENIPIRKYNIKSLEEEIDNMVSLGKITIEDKRQIKIEKIFSFLTSDVYDIMLSAEVVQKEHKITFLTPAKYYDDTLTSGDILTEGVVDLLFIKDDIYYIVDYKTDNVTDESELIKRYKLQLDLYEIGIRDNMNAKNVKKFIYSIMLDKFIEV